MVWFVERLQGFRVLAPNTPAAARPSRGGAHACPALRMPPPQRHCARSAARRKSPTEGRAPQGYLASAWVALGKKCATACTCKSRHMCTFRLLDTQRALMHREVTCCTTWRTPASSSAGRSASSLRSLLPPRTGCSRSSWMTWKVVPLRPSTVLTCAMSQQSWTVSAILGNAVSASVDHAHCRCRSLQQP